MDIRLVRIGIEDAEKLWNMQITAFKELYDKYQDTETSVVTVLYPIKLRRIIFHRQGG